MPSSSCQGRARRAALVPAAVAATEAEFGERLNACDADGTALRGKARDDRRQLLAGYYRAIGRYLNQLEHEPLLRETPAGGPPPEVARLVESLTPRPREVLDRLLAGDSEKEVARALGISRHTVHDHAKLLYKTFGVASRGELLARFVRG